MTPTELNPCFVLIMYLGYVHTFDIHNLYKQYKEAPGEGPRYLVLRRTFRQNATEYQIHIKRLKEVNALKQHNLMRSNDSLINLNETVYINNPVEAKLPQAFLTFNQFKQTLLAKVLKDRDELRKQKLQAVIQNLWENRKKRKPTTRKVKTSNIIKLVMVDSKNKKHKKSPKLTTKVGKTHVGKVQNVNVKTTLTIKMNHSDIKAEKEHIKISEGTPAVQELDSTADSKIIIVPLEPVAVEKAKDDTTKSNKTTAKSQTRHDNHTTNQPKFGNTVANKTKVTLVSIAEKIVLKASDEETTAPTDLSDETTLTDQNTAHNESVIESTASGELELTGDMKTTTESVSHYLGVVKAEDEAEDDSNATESSDTDDKEGTTTPTIETATTAEDKSYEYAAEEEAEEPTTTTTEKVTLGRPRVFMGR